MSTLTLAQAKSLLNITGNGSDSDLQDVIDAAEAVIENYCGPLGSTAVTARVMGGGSLALPTVPVLALTSVTPVDGSALTLGDLYLDPVSGLVSYDSGTTLSARYYTVVYNAGRDPVPDDLMEAVRALVRHLWETRRGPTRRPSADTDPVVGASYALPRRVEQLIAPHMQVVVG